MESFLNLNIWAGLLCPSIFLLLTTDNTIGKQTRIHLSAVHLTCVSSDYGRKLKHMQPEPNATNNCFKFLKSLVKVTANHRAKRTDMVHLIWVVWYKLCNLRPSEWVNWQVSLRTSRNIRGVFRDTKGVFCFESKHEGARRRENAIGGVGELRSSRKKKRAKHRQEERDRENWKWAEIKKKELQLERLWLKTSLQPGFSPASDGFRALSESLSKSLTIPGIERMTGSVTHISMPFLQPGNVRTR